MPNKSRDLQFTTQQLVGVFLSILALGVFIFLLGISVGKKSAVLAGPSPRPSVQAQRADVRPGVIPRRPAGDIQKELDAHARTSDVPAETNLGTKPGPAAVKTEAKPDAKAAEMKTAAGAPKTSPLTAKKTEAKLPAKTAEDKPAAAAPKTEPPGVKKAEPKPANKTAVDKAPAKTAEKAAAKPEPTKVPAVSAGVWYIQVAATDTKDGALSVARRMEQDGWPMVVLDPLPTDKKPFFRIRVGPYATAAEANAAKAKLADATGKTDYWVVKL